MCHRLGDGNTQQLLLLLLRPECMTTAAAAAARLAHRCAALRTTAHSAPCALRRSQHSAHHPIPGSSHGSCWSPLLRHQFPSDQAATRKLPPSGGAPSNFSLCHSHGACRSPAERYYAVLATTASILDYHRYIKSSTISLHE